MRATSNARPLTNIDYGRNHRAVCLRPTESEHDPHRRDHSMSARPLVDPGSQSPRNRLGRALRNEIWGVETPNGRLARSLERIEARNVIGASRSKLAPQGSARCARRPRPPLTCALAAADWQLWRAAMPLAGVQTSAERKKNFRNYCP
jgi:hypothetical protein